MEKNPTIFTTLNVNRRVNQGLNAITIISAETLNLNSAYWQQILNNTSALDVNLPDATLLKTGWEVVVKNDIASTYELVVKDAGTGEVKTVDIGKAFKFTLIDNGTAAGVWHVSPLDDQAIAPAIRYTETFNATTDWTDDTAGYYFILFEASVHGMGVDPSFETSIDDGIAGGGYNDASTGYSMSSNGDITIFVPTGTPECRFGGKIVIM